MKHITSLFTLLALMTATGTLAQNDVKQDATKNQVQLKLADGTSKRWLPSPLPRRLPTG